MCKYFLLTDTTNNELYIHLKASDLNLAVPIIHSHDIDILGNKYRCIVMNKYNYTLKDNVLLTKTLPIDVQKRIIFVLSNLHKNKILHNDATSSNWMYNKEDMSDLVLIDFGDSEIKENITTNDVKGDYGMLYNSLKYSAKLEESQMTLLAEQI